METPNYRFMFNKVNQLLETKKLHNENGFLEFCPHYQYVWLDALKKEDWPNGIRDNSVFLAFNIDFKNKTVELHRSGHIWLTKEDQAKSYLCMCGMKKAVSAVGQKWFRKQSWKDEKDLVNKMTNFYTTTIQNIDKVTGGYPYKQMIVNIY